MPPKPKFTAEEIIAAALQLVSRQGIQALTAKSLGAALECSASPLFTVFNSMGEIRDGVRAAALRQFEAYSVEVEPGTPHFKRIGITMVTFAMQEPQLYQLLFMQHHQRVAFHDIFPELGTTAEQCITTLQQEYHLTEAQAQTTFENVWIYTFGIGALCATGVCYFSAEELSRRLSTEFQAILQFVTAPGQSLPD